MAVVAADGCHRPWYTNGTSVTAAIATHVSISAITSPISRFDDVLLPVHRALQCGVGGHPLAAQPIDEHVGERAGVEHVDVVGERALAGVVAAERA